MTINAWARNLTILMINLAALLLHTSGVAQSETAILLPGQTATALPDGRRLLVGGTVAGRVIARAAIWNPGTGTVIPLSATLQQPRAWHSATILPDGSILILGGVGEGGGPLAIAEWYHPESQNFSVVSLDHVTPRSHHTATLVTDGNVLLVGGLGERGQQLVTAELWNSNDGSVVALPQLSRTRHGHNATLLSNGKVLLWGGIGSVETGELFDPKTGQFEFLNSFPNNLFPSADDVPVLIDSLPPNLAVNVPSDSLIALRFSSPLLPQTVSAATVTLSGPRGIEAINVIPAENGMLAFITPAELLLRNANYVVSINGARANNGTDLPASGFSFSTRPWGASVDANPRARVGGDIQVIQATPANAPDQPTVAPPEDWKWQGALKNGKPHSPWQDLPPLSADAGVTALAGQVLNLRGTPLAGVRITIAHHYRRGETSAVTDETGRFLLTRLNSGRNELIIDGRSARNPSAIVGSPAEAPTNHGVFKYGIEIDVGTTNKLPFTIWLTKIDSAHAVKIDSPTNGNLVITTPHIPNLEAHVAAGTVIKDHEGSVIREIGITPIPLDRTPFPLPREVNPPVYFTIQPGGGYVYGHPGIRLIYPNYANHPRPAGTRLDFWHYDPEDRAWYIYGKGTVSNDLKQVVPDDGVSVYELTGAMIGQKPPPPKRTCGNDDNQHGDPVDLCNGLFYYTQTDLVVPDVIPLVLSRTYNQNDPETANRDFGLGASHPYNIFLYSTNNFQEADLILPDGARIHYVRTSPGTDFLNAFYEHTATPTRYFKSTLHFDGFPGSRWVITLKDGTKYRFAESCPACQSGTLLGIEDRNGNKVKIERMFVNGFNDPAGPLTQLTSPSGRWIKFENNINQYPGFVTTKAWDSLGRTVRYEYEQTTGLLKRVTDPAGGVWEYTYDSSNRMITVRDPGSVTILTNEYNADGRVSRQTLAEGEFFTFTYTTDTNGNVTQTDITDSTGDVRRVTFNAEGFTLTDTRSFGTSLAQTVTYQRQPGTNFVTSVTDTGGKRTDIARDAMGNVTSVTNSANVPGESLTTNFSFDTGNRLTNITDPLNHSTTFGYDPKGNLATVTSAVGLAASFTYDSAGRRTSLTDSIGRSTLFSYDSVGDLVSLTNAAGDVGTQFLDAGGRLVEATSPAGSKTRFDYDLANRVTRITDSVAGQTNFSYDAVGNLRSITDAKSQTNSFTYDNDGRLTSRTDPLLRQEAYEYDGRGRLIRFTDRNNRPIAHDYDVRNRRTKTTYADLSTSTFTYDTSNRLTQIVDSKAGNITRTYDNHDRLTSETTPQGSIAYTYDAAGRRASMTVAGQPAVTYTYDNANRLTQINQGSATVSIAYDAAGRRRSIILPGGNAMEYSYDAGSRITEIKYTRGGTVLGNVTYEYDKDGKRTKTGGSFGRSGIPQPITGVSYNLNNQQIVFGTKILTYDNNGNLTTVADESGTTIYTWDARNLLVGINGPGLSASFAYDAIGRRTRRTVNGATTEFLYDGTNPVQELSGGAVTANLLTGLGIDERFTRTDSTGRVSFLTDILGSTIALTDASGAITTEYTYDPFGKVTSTGSPNANPYQYTGRENDGTGLYYYRARYYHPELQRFLSEDPIGFSGSGVNFYPYVNNAPVNYTDPLGLFFPHVHNRITRNAAAAAGCSNLAGPLAKKVALVDFKPGSQDVDNAHWHGMCGPGNAGNPARGQQLIDQRIQDRLNKCNLDGLGDALHAAQDSYPMGHRGCRPWQGWMTTPIVEIVSHAYYDYFPAAAEALAQAESQRLIEQFKQRCECVCQ